MTDEQMSRIIAMGIIFGLWPFVSLLAKHLIGKWTGHERCRDETLRYCLGYAWGRIWAACKRYGGQAIESRKVR